MGLFNKLRGESELDLTPQAALLLSAITMVAADGDVDDNELAIIKRLDGSNQTKDWDTSLRAWRSKSVSECIEILTAALSQEQQIATIANLIDIAMADGILVGEEKTLLEAYVSAFSVQESQISQMVDVISVKNDKSIFNK